MKKSQPPSVKNSTLDTHVSLNWESVAIVARKAETELIKTSIASLRHQDAQARAILIHGESGTGKSALIKAVIQHELLRAPNTILSVAGKFDQNADASSPFRAAAAALTELCHLIRDAPNSSKHISSIIKTLGSDDLHILAKVVPAVHLFFPNGNKMDSGRARENTAGMSESGIIRFTMIFRRFLNASCSPDTPLVMFLDDLQWADDASHKLIVSILRDSNMTNFLLIGAVRDGEQTTFEVPSDAVVAVKKLTCAPFDVQHVAEMVAKSTNADPAESRIQELGVLVHSRTQGNPYFVKQFMDSLLRTKLMTHNVAAGTFEWDCSAIAANTNPSANVIELMIDNIKALPYNSRLILVIAASIGHTFKTEVLEVLLSSVDLVCQISTSLKKDSGSKAPRESAVDMLSDDDVKVALKQACQGKLICTTDVPDQYRFSHDRVQQSAMAVMPAGENGKRIKSTIGTLMWELSRSSESEDWMLYSACNLLLESGSSELQPGEIAELALRAAKKAASQAAFKSAAQYAARGFKILRRDGWNTHYTLCLELCCLSAEAHFANGNLKASKYMVTLVDKKATTKEDTFRAHHVLLDVLSAENDFVGCIRESLSGLRAIGIKGPENPNKFGVIRNLIRAKRMLGGRKPSELTSLPRMTDPMVIEATRLLSVLAASCFFCGDDNRCLMGCLQMFQLTLKHGISEQGPFAIAIFGFVLSHLGDLKPAHEFGIAALEVSRRPGMEISVAKTNSVCHNALWHLKLPFRDSPAALVEAAKCGLNNGDPLQSFMVLCRSASFSIFVTKSLQTFDSEMKRICETLTEYKQKGQLAVLLPWAQFIENMQGKAENPYLLNGSFLDERDVVRTFEACKNIVINRHALLNTHYARLILFYVCGVHQEAENDRKKYARVKGEAGTYYLKLFHFCFAALDCYALAISTREKKQKYMSQAKKYVSLIQSYGTAGSPNTPPMLELLEAERLTAQGREIQAVSLYQTAASQLHEGQFYLLEAIAYERAGVSSKTLDETKSAQLLETARHKYSDYGATVKVQLLQEGPNLSLRAEHNTLLQIL